MGLRSISAEISLKKSRKHTREVPIASAIITLIVCGVLIMGIAAAIIANITSSSDDIGIQLDGTWEIYALTYNDEHITYVFARDTFSRLTESVVFDTNPEAIMAIREYHELYYGAHVDIEDLDDGILRLRIIADGTFAIDSNVILLVSGEGHAVTLPFFWESENIALIDGYRFMRR